MHHQIVQSAAIMAHSNLVFNPVLSEQNMLNIQPPSTPGTGTAATKRSKNDLTAKLSEKEKSSN